MPAKIDWSVDVTVAGGPKTSLSRSLDVNAYDKIEVTIPKKGDPNAGATTVDVQPSGQGKVKFLLITSSLYQEKLTFKVDDNPNEIKLDAPQLLTGDGLIGLLGATQKKFVFKNDVEPPAPATVQILVGRAAT